MSYKPNKGMIEEANRGLEWRREFGRGGTAVGVARARDISNGKNLSEETVKRMYSYFSRHEVDKKGQGYNQGEKGYPSAGRIAWALWGGNSAFSWSRAIVERLKKEDERSIVHETNLETGDNMTEELEKRHIVDVQETEEAYVVTFAKVHEEEVEEAEVTDEVVEVETTEERFDRGDMEKRAHHFAREDKFIDEENRLVRVGVSTEEPVERDFGMEVIDHSRESMNLEFLNSGRAPLLLDHDMSKVLGVVESVEMDEKARRLRAVVRFGKGALASEVFDDVKDGIRQNISVGYRIDSRVRRDDDPENYVRVATTPMEISIVSIPADQSSQVGVGRSTSETLTQHSVQKEIIMSEEVKHDIVDVEAVKADAVRAARKNDSEILSLAAKHNQRSLGEKAIAEGKSADQFRGELLEVIGDKPLETAEVGLSKKEVREFSVLRAIRAMANPTDRQAQEEARFEIEVSEAAQRVNGRTARGIMLPTDVLRSWAQRDLNTSDDAGLIAQDFRGGDFIDVLRNASSVMAAGATMLNGLSGNVAIPKKSAASSAGWIATEGAASAESEPTFGQVTMSPKVVGSHSQITRLMLQQSSLDIENLIRNDLAQGIALAIDLGALAGSGSSGQPTGIQNTSGINAPTAFAAANPTFAEVVAMETAVAEDNALMGNLAYILGAGMYGALKTTAKDAGSGQFVVGADGQINGYNAIVSNQVTAGDLYFGNFADLLIGMYGGLDIVADPYSNSTSGTVNITALQTVDVAVRNATSFAFNNDGA